MAFDWLLAVIPGQFWSIFGQGEVSKTIVHGWPLFTESISTSFTVYPLMSLNFAVTDFIWTNIGMQFAPMIIHNKAEFHEILCMLTKLWDTIDRRDKLNDRLTIPTYYIYVGGRLLKYQSRKRPWVANDRNEN